MPESSLPPDVTLHKAELRARFRTYRLGLTPDAYARRSARIQERALALIDMLEAETVHLYLAATARREVGTARIVEALHAAGRTVVVPVIDPDAAGPVLTHRRYEAGMALTPNRWGIGEPLSGPAVPVGDIDLVLVPALGAARDGHRLGYGAGYYDAFLRTVRAPTAGLVFEACLVDTLPTQPHDVSLTHLVTESAMLHTGQS